MNVDFNANTVNIEIQSKGPGIDGTDSKITLSQPLDPGPV